jgi:hypothetical protein
MPPFLFAKKARRYGEESSNRVSRPTIPDAPFVHLFVPNGAVELEGSGLLQTGDVARLFAAESSQITADYKIGADVLIWESNPEITNR